MKFSSWPSHYDEILTTMDWLGPLAAREVSVLEPLARWLKDGNHSYSDIPPGIRNEVFFKDLTTGESRASGQWREWGWTENDMAGIRWQEKAHPTDRDFLYNNLATANIFDGIRISQSVFRIIDHLGEYHWNLASSAAIHWASDGTIHRYVGRDLDIGSRLERELRLRRGIHEVEERSIRDSALLEAAGSIAAVTDQDGLAAAIEDAVPRILGMDTFRLIVVSQGISRILLGPDLPDNRDIRTRLIEIAENSEGSTELTGIRCASIPSGREFFSAWDLGHISQGRAFAVLRSGGGCDDGIDRLMRALGPIILRAWDQLAGLEELRRHATTDPLTGAWNRRPFLEQAGRRLRRNFEGGSGTTVVMLDIDHFKKVNDTFGHPRGDQVLSAVSRGIGRTLRAGDLMCRWGGEEFAVFIDGVTGDDAVHAVERIREAASSVGTDAIGVADYHVTLSAGVCVIPPEDHISLEAALDRADKALLRAKQAGRNRSEISQSSSVRN